uniref:Thioredoxin domain containing 15 n=1 Tax=Callorhinchus milii TaxID=7868 RepID=A0A4W3HBL4_CALMI|eukprot:gi/632966581/ref/XP_007899497.1/ PREDICTED: thioredoxin domain-containing protein 15 [Callorhinchus milii]
MAPMGGSGTGGLGLAAALLLLLLLRGSGASAADAEAQRNDEALPAEDARITSSPQHEPDRTDRQAADKPEIKKQFPTAEIADAVLGTGIAAYQEALLSLIQNAKNEHSGALEDKGTPCPGGGTEQGKCNIPVESFASIMHIPAESQAGEVPAERESGVLLGLMPAESSSTEEPNGTETSRAPKVTCEERNTTKIENFAVQILNSSQDLMEFLNANGSDCSIVLFYTPWCRFSADLGPHFNVLPRAFPSLQFLALDASQHSSLSTRFGTVAVPNILLFQGVKPMARFNQTERTLSTLKAFIFNQTGIEADGTVKMTEQDLNGPLPSVAVRGIDWLLGFSVLFVFAFLVYGTIQSESIKWLIPGQEHEHQD